jgi:hypothetical protein
MLLGFVSSTIPSLLKYFERKQEIAYELELTKLKIEAAVRGYEVTTEIADIDASISEGESVRKHDALLDGGDYINALRASVRPVVTYAFFGLFLLVKLSVAFVIIMHNGLTIDNMELVQRTVLDEPTNAVFAVIVGFWFGSRNWEKTEAAISKWFGYGSTSTKVKTNK